MAQFDRLDHTTFTYTQGLVNVYYTFHVVQCSLFDSLTQVDSKQQICYSVKNSVVGHN